MHVVGSAIAATTFLAFVAIVAGAFYRPGDALALARFSQWTNAAFVWPAARAATLGAYSESIVFTVTLVVSTLHHGCLKAKALREALAVETFWLLGSALIVLVVVVAVAASLRRPRYYGYATVAATALVLVVATTLNLAATDAAAKRRLDGCALPHEPDNVQYDFVLSQRAERAWSTSDFVTAFAALGAVRAAAADVAHSRARSCRDGLLFSN